MLTSLLRTTRKLHAILDGGDVAIGAVSTDLMENKAVKLARSITPAQWPWALSAPPLTSSEATGWQGALVRRWSGTSPVMVQPPLNEHYVVMHLGGPKHVLRRNDGAPVSAIAECGSLTLVPAGTAFIWRTTGPISFAHLYVHPRLLQDTLESNFDLDGRNATLFERVGCREPVLEALFVRMLGEIEGAHDASPLLLDSLLESCLVRLAQKHVPLSLASRSKPVALAPHRLKRVLEYIDAGLDRPLALADLVAAAGNSQFHFSRAFHAATGRSPYQYLIARRIEHAKVLLMTADVDLATVAMRCGFKSAHQFAVMFKRHAGVGPKRFRLARATRATRAGVSRARQE